MLFGKTRRIKELEKENAELRWAVSCLNSIPRVIGREPRKVETYVARKILSYDMSREFRESAIKDYLFAELIEKCPHVIVTSEYDPSTDNSIMTASIDILVKER